MLPWIVWPQSLPGTCALQDYRVHLKHTDGHFEHVPYFSLPANDLTDVIAPSCYSCFDYPNALADLVSLSPPVSLCLQQDSSSLVYTFYVICLVKSADCVFCLINFACKSALSAHTSTQGEVSNYIDLVQAKHLGEKQCLSWISGITQWCEGAWLC